MRKNTVSQCCSDIVRCSTRTRAFHGGSCRYRDGQTPVKWIVSLDPRGETSARYRCKHVCIVDRTNVPGEEVDLLPPCQT